MGKNVLLVIDLRFQFFYGTVFYNLTFQYNFFSFSAEVNSARSRLSGALSTAERFVDKYAGDDFPLSPHKRLQSLDSPFPSPTKSPRGVRRRRKKPIALNTAFHHTVVMKLFDRSLDLAQFAEDTSLYPGKQLCIHINQKSTYFFFNLVIGVNDYSDKFFYNQVIFRVFVSLPLLGYIFLT